MILEREESNVDLFYLFMHSLVGFCIFLDTTLVYQGDSLTQGCRTHSHPGPHQPRSCLQRAEIILGLYKCNYSLTVKELKLHLAL